MTTAIDEGYIKFYIQWSKEQLPHYPNADLLCRVRNKVYQQGWVGFDSKNKVGYGNLSTRINDAPLPFLITGTQTGHIEVLTPGQLSVVEEVSFDRHSLRCRGAVKASSESVTHAAFYKLERPEIGAVIHIHNALLWYRLHEEGLATAEGVAYGTPEMAASIEVLNIDGRINDSGLLAMSGHEDGVIAWGKDPEHAYQEIIGYYSDLI